MEEARIGAMFDQQSLESMFVELRDEYELEPDWEDIQRNAHLGVAWADSGMLDEKKGDLDSRVLSYIEKFNPS